MGSYPGGTLPRQSTSFFDGEIYYNENVGQRGLVDVLPQGNGIFFFRLSKDSGCKIILEGGPRLITGRHLFLRRWEAGLNLSVEAVDRIPVWI